MVGFSHDPPGTPEPHPARVEGQRKINEARAVYDKAIEQGSASDKVYVARARLRENDGDRAGAIEDLDKAIELAPTADSYARRGLVKQREGKKEQAQADFRQALQLDPNRRLARENLEKSGAGD